MKSRWISGFCNDGNCEGCKGEYKRARPGGQSAFCAHPHHVYEEDADVTDVPEEAARG